MTVGSERISVCIRSNLLFDHALFPLCSANQSGARTGLQNALNGSLKEGSKSHSLVGEFGALKLSDGTLEYANGVPDVQHTCPFTREVVFKFMCYAISKGYYPNVTYHVWNHVVVTKLKLSSDVAWAYFQAFYNLTPRNTSKEKRYLKTRHEYKAQKNDDHSWKSKLSVNLVEFALYMFCQNYIYSSVKRKGYSGELVEWPSEKGYGEGKQNQSTAKRTLGRFVFAEEANRIAFVKDNIHELLEFLYVESEFLKSGRSLNTLEQLCSLKLSQNGSKVTILADCLDHLNCLLCGLRSFDEPTNRKPSEALESIQLTGLALLEPSKSGAKSDGNIQVDLFKTWLTSKLDHNPCDIGVSLAGNIHIERKRPHENSDEIAASCSSIPEMDELTLALKPYNINRISKRTIALGEEMSGRNIRIFRCHKDYIYILSAVKSVNVYGCRNSTIVIGSASASVTVSHSQRTTVICCSRTISVTNSEHCQIFALVNTRPVIPSFCNKEVKIGPLNAFYPTLGKHLKDAAIYPKLNYWDDPIVELSITGNNNGNMNPSTATSTLLPPSDYYNFVVPFSVEGETNTIPCEVPEKYQNEIERKASVVVNFRRKFRNCDMSNEQKLMFQGAIETRFQEWLREQGLLRQIHDLVYLSKESKKDASNSNATNTSF
eukprot:Nk52_evm46s2367 gene=Nk52_evmTU46s2367